MLLITGSKRLLSFQNNSTTLFRIDLHPADSVNVKYLWQELNLNTFYFHFNSHEFYPLNLWPCFFFSPSWWTSADCGR